MITEILPGFYQLQVPFPNNPLRNINIHVVKSDGMALMVDTGINLEDTRSAIIAGLEEIKVDLTKTGFFLTHMHPDHTGLLSRLTRESSKVYMSESDAALFQNYIDGGNWEERIKTSTRFGFPKEDLIAMGNYPMFGERERVKNAFSFISDGDIIEVGDYRFRCIATPGHTRGHFCLYEPTEKILLAGDHILQDISPNVSSMAGGSNPLADYLLSLDKIYRLDVTLVLPGHRRFFSDARERIRELRHHHEVRANEALSIVKKERLNAYQVASRMTWDMNHHDWATAPVYQRMFAMGEALAHLKYLASEGEIIEEQKETEVTYSAV